MKNDKLSILSGVLLALIAAAAFVLSFDAIRELAVANGVKYELAWIVPIIVDLAMVVFSLARIRNVLAGDDTGWVWFLILLFTAVSIAFNVAHSNEQLWGIIIAALAPIALFASFETLMSQIQNGVRRSVNGLVKRWHGRANVLLRIAKEWRSRANELERIVNEYATALERSEAKAADEKDRRIAAEKRVKDIQLGMNHMNDLAKDIFVMVTTGEGTGAAIAEKHGVSEAHVSKIKSYMNGATK